MLCSLQTLTATHSLCGYSFCKGNAVPPVGFFVCFGGFVDFFLFIGDLFCFFGAATWKKPQRTEKVKAALALPHSPPPTPQQRIEL